jgi:hypothetical protein
MLSPKLKRLREASWDKLTVGALYRIVGQFHIERSDGSLAPVHAGTALAGLYQGQMAGDTRRHLFTDHDGDRYIVSDPDFTWGIATARVYAFAAKRTRATVAA